MREGAKEPPATEVPTGTVTFLFTDIEGSTRLLQLGEKYVWVLREHHRIVRQAAEEQGGREIDSHGESSFFAFERANAAVGAAVLAQRILSKNAWPEEVELGVRMGLHTGEPVVGDERYVGLDPHHAGRIGGIAHGGQVLLSSVTRELLEDGLAGVTIRDLGSYRFEEIDRDERLYQLDVAGLRSDFPPLRAKRVAAPRAISQAEAEIGAEFLGYRIEKLIGRGGMGVVYRVYDLRLKRTVALKLVTPELARDERFRDRFVRETELAMSLEHPNVVPIHDAGEVAGRLYLAMRLVSGTDLRRLLRAEGTLEPPRALAICRQVANALDAAHARALVHRDVKPSNVLLDESEHAYLADFGLTRRLEEQGAPSGEGRSVGTPAYLAPEQIEGKPVDGRADVYSLGCVLFECLTGTAPYPRDSRLGVAWSHLEEEPPSASESNAELPDAIDPVISRALAKEPDHRYPTCAALLDAAEAALGFGSRGRTRRRLVAVGLAAAAIVAAAAAAFALLTRSDKGTPTVVPNSLVKIDARTRKIVDVIPVGRVPSEVVVAGDYVFVTSQADGTLTKVNRRTGVKVATSGQYDANGGLAWEGGHRLWVGSSRLDRVQLVDTQLPESLFFDEVAPFVRIPLGAPYAVLAIGAGSLWIGASGPSGFGSVVERWGLHPLRRLRTYPLQGESWPIAAAFGTGAAWVALGNPADAILRIDAQTGHPRRIPVGTFPTGVATGFGSVWVADRGENAIRRIDPGTGRTEIRIRVGSQPLELAADRDSIWVSNHCSGTVARIDPQTNTVADTIKTGLYPQWLAADHHDFVWVGVAGKPYFDPCPAPNKT